jgi:hypothetical protein
MSSESRGYSCKEAGSYARLTFISVSSDIVCQMERDLGLHELIHRYLEEDGET